MPEPTPAATLIERPCPFITFYSFKGGVGRSMAVINVAGIMASRGFRVMVVDMDLEAPGLSFLANPPPNDGEPRPLQPGFVDFMLDAVDRGADADLFQLSAADAVQHYSAPYELPEGFRRSPDGSLRIMPAGRLDNGYAGRLTRLDLPSLYRDGTGLALIQAFKQAVQDSKLFDYVFIDSRTGFSDESGICTRDLADCLMVVSGLNRQNVEGTARFLSTLRQATEVQKPLEVILSPIPNGEDTLVDNREAQARDAFSRAWGTTIHAGLHIPYHPQLALTEEPHIFRQRRGYLFEAYNRIEKSILHLLGDLWHEILNSSIVALRDKEYAKAEASFRRISKLVDPHEWIDVNLLVPDPAWIADAGAEGLFGYIVLQANPAAKERLGRWIASEALRRETTTPHIAKALYERALMATPENAATLGNYARFLAKEGINPNATESMYERAIALDPKNAINLGNYAYFLWKKRRNIDAAEAMYTKALDIDPKQINNLGAYANLLWRERKDIETAKALYRQALDLDPNHANTLGSYASMLWEERIDIDAAEAMFEQAITADPRHAFNLGRLAQFLWRERGTIDAAATMFNRALEADPKQLSNLGNYATFLWEERKEIEAAEAMYKRAIDADPNHANNLGNYASFLWEARKEIEAAEAMYERTIDADPNHANNLGRYANFLWIAKTDPSAAEAMYKRALTAAPRGTSNLTNYASFLVHGKKDLDAAEATFKQALETAPSDIVLLSNHALFLWLEQGKPDAAEVVFKNALQADASDVNCLGNYGCFCLAAGRVSEGMQFVDRALAIRADTSSPEVIDAECWMYVFCCAAPDRRLGALQQLRTLVEVHSVSTGDWDFSGVIQQARTMAHPEAARLPLLADVLGGRRPPDALDDWSAWRAAAPQ
jgi:Tfp pilus assembly protein PilF/MinD-like ATPase involved in chromosome partitioning or flagellar assembly